MRKLTRAVVAATASLCAVVAVAGEASADYPTTPFGRYEITGGATAGGLIWYNWSVGVQGYVVDSAKVARDTTVYFDFYGADDFYVGQTRTADGETRSFNFTVQGPIGGITKVEIQLCTVNGCTVAHQFTR
ncbi:hypothetical protein M8542_26630 [Amycolatopsis sp. OK19-0408]|uniref:Uncharacterized protein n=1 Tax=Amycolatopsis iheyensis TaxID=2945988 RepID=A0A9X2NFM6_9PSEU|nr:hypothetical protein [Amycolatopsis iheyensis]MCR6486408.1 hypothetical protein [Amycolatopsis iheyensis]